MKIVYPSGAIGIHIPYQHSDFKTKEQFDLRRNIYQKNEETEEYELVGQDDCSVEWDLDDIRYIAGEHIRRYYPEYKQLNVIRTGTEQEQAKMTVFIDAVRAWSNSENPDPWDGTLELITPTE
jgi:tRNA(Ser,Leu) C12 N-acetylase TAN1